MKILTIDYPKEEKDEKKIEYLSSNYKELTEKFLFSVSDQI